MLQKFRLDIWAAGNSLFLLCTFAFHGPGVALIIKIVAEIESSDDLRSELCRLVLSGSV